VRNYELNKRTFRPGQPKWRVAAKWVLRHTEEKEESRIRLEDSRQSRCETVGAKRNELYARPSAPRSSFRFRFAPMPDYLNWRYNLTFPSCVIGSFGFSNEEKTSLCHPDARPNEFWSRNVTARTPKRWLWHLAQHSASWHKDIKPRPVSWSAAIGNAKIYKRFGFRRAGRTAIRAWSLDPTCG